jgi:serine O-acetyltransferase
VEEHRKTQVDLEHGKLPDPVAEAIKLVLNEQTKLEERLNRLEKGSGISVPEDELRQQVFRIVREFSQSGNSGETEEDL